MWIDKDQEDESLGQEPDSLNSPSVGAGGSGGAPIKGSETAAVGTPSSMSPTPEAPGQQFGTIQDYFKGSKTQGEKLGQEFTGKLDATKQQQQSAIGQAAAGAEQNIAANTIGADTALINKAKVDPTKVANDEAQYDAFMSQWNAAYKGPDSFEATDEYSNAAKAAQAAKDKATQASSTGGRQQILQDEFNVYGAGNKGLDEALIQQSGSFGDVDTKAKELNSLQDYLKTKSGEVGTKAAEAKATTAQTKQAAQDALLGEQGAVRQFKTDIDTKTTQERAKAEADQKALADAFGKRAALSNEQLKQLGLTQEQYQNLINKEKTAGYTNLQDYLTFQNPNAQISRETVASQGDQSKDAALAKLTGGTKLLGATREGGKLVDFNQDSALQTYLDKIGADEAERARAKAEREAQQRAEQEQHDAEETAKRKETQGIAMGTPLATAALGPLGYLPGISGPIGQKVNEIISKDKTASAITGAVDRNVTQPVVSAVKSVAKSISKAFCFDGETPVEMVDGSKVVIKDIKLGDRIKGGGMVLSTRQSLTSNGTRYDYNGVIVTGFHAVKEKKWLRVRDSAHARRIDGGGTVYSLVTTLHRIYVNGIQFADEHETDMYEHLSINESLNELNKSNRIVLEVR